MAKVMTIQGADQTVSTQPAVIIAGWDWKHIVGVIGGVAAVAGGATLAVLGHRRDKKVWLYTGIGTGVVGIGAIVTSIWLARIRERALLGGRLPADTHPSYPQLPQRAAQPGDKVLLGDGRKMIVDDVQILLGNTRQLTVHAVNDHSEQDYIEDEQIKRVLN